MKKPKKHDRVKRTNLLTMLHFVFEILVALGFFIGLFPFGYLFSFWWVIPLTIVNLFFSLVKKSGTLQFDLTNVFMSVLALIPIVGYVARVAGIAMAVLSSLKLGVKLV